MALLRVVGIVLLTLIALTYAAMFVSWNPGTTAVVGCKLPTGTFVEDLPVWSLPFIGGVIGVLAMLFSTWALWSGQKRQTDRFKKQVDKAKKIIIERNNTIEKQEQRVAELEAALAETATAPAAPAEDGEDAPTETHSESQPPVSEPDEDDDEVI
jgi:hypothetical protein